MNKKLLVVTLALSIAVYTLPVFAQDNSLTPSSVPLTPSGWRRRLNRDIRNDKRDLFQDIRRGIRNKLGLARILGGTVTGVNGSSLTVSKNGKTFTVNTDASTTFRRHFWGKSSISEISVNDIVNVWGKWTDDAKTTIQARMVRDLSIMKRFGSFVGTISNLSGNTFTLNTVHRGAQTVTLSGSTTCVDRKMQTINCSTDLQNGHRVRVKGVWDDKNKTITEVSQVKDYSLPPQPTPGS